MQYYVHIPYHVTYLTHLQKYFGPILKALSEGYMAYYFFAGVYW